MSSCLSRRFLVEPLEQRTLLSCDPALRTATLDPALPNQIRAAGTQISTFLTNVQSTIYDKVLAQPLPLLGTPFKGLKGTPLDLLQPLINATKLITLATPQLNLCDMYDVVQGALHILAPGSTSTIDAKVFDPANWTPGQTIHDAGLDITLRGDLIDKAFHPTIIPGIKGLKLNLTGELDVTFGYEIHLLVGVDAHGFYLDTGTQVTDATGTHPLPEARLSLDVTAPGIVFTGTLPFFRVTAADHGTHLSTGISLDLQDGPDADTKLRLGELPSPTQMVKGIKVDGNAHVDLLASLDLNNAQLPGISADLVIDWNFGGVDTTNPLSLDNFGQSPNVEFRDVTIDLGSALSRFLSPVLKKVNDVIEPVRPMLRALKARVAILSDVPSLVQQFDADAVGALGHGEVSILEVLQKLDPGGFVAKFFGAVDALDNLVGGGRSLGTSNVAFNLGSFRIIGDLRHMLPEDLAGGGQGVINKLTNTLPTLPPEVGNLVNTLENGSVFGSGSEGFHIPLLEDPFSVFGLLLGQPVGLMTFTMPRLITGPTLDVSFPLIGPLSVRLLGSITVNAQFSFGYDSFGLQTWAAGGFRLADIPRIADGFYVSDRANADGTGADVDEMVVQASVRGGLDVNVGIASAMVGGGIAGQVKFNLNDPNNDGKVRLGEMKEIQNNHGNLFDVSGRLYAELFATGQVLGSGFEITFATTELWHTDPSAHAATPLPLPDLTATSLVFTQPNAFNPRLLNYSLTVGNPGAANAGAANATIYLSDDDQITPSDVPVANVPLGALAQAQIKTYTGSITLPNNPFATDNQYFLGAIVDDGNAVAESDETNNVNLGAGTPAPYSFSVESDLPSPSPTDPALVTPVATTLAFDMPAKGSLVDELIGPADEDIYQFAIGRRPPRFPPAVVGLDVDAPGGVNTYLRLYDANWNLVAQNDDGLSPAESVGHGESYIELTSFGGTYYAVVSHAGNTSGDPRVLAGRTNGVTGFGPYVFTLLSDPHALPDLVPVSFTSTGDMSTNFRFTTLNVQNQGTGDAGQFFVRYYVSEDPNITTSDTVLAAATVGPLAAGASTTVQQTLDLGGVFGPDDPFKSDNQYFIGVILNDNPVGPPIVEAATYNDSNQGPGIDMIPVSSEADLPVPADGVNVVARPIASSNFGVTVQSDIGDEYIGHADIDVFRFTITDTGAQARIDIDPFATFRSGVALANSYLRLYDANWTLLAQSTNQLARGETSESPAGAYIEHNFRDAGTYYAVVSTDANAAADPRVLTGRSAGPKGGYNLTLTVFPFFSQSSNLSVTSFTTTSSDYAPAKDTSLMIGNFGSGDANLFDVRYYLSDNPGGGGPTSVLLKTARVNSLAAGASVTLNDHFDLPTLPWLTDNEYYLTAVVDAENRVYEDSAFPILGSILARADAHLPSPTNGNVAATTLGPGTSAAGSIGLDEFAGRFDADTYAVALEAGQTVTLDVNSNRSALITTLDNFLRGQGEEWTLQQLDDALTPVGIASLQTTYGRRFPIRLPAITAAGNLDAFLRLYDSNWNLVASNDNGTSPTDAFDYRDPYLTYTPASPGTYYAVVTSNDDTGNDPLSLAGRRAGATQGGYTIAAGATLAGSLVGQVIEDGNANGIADRSEPGMPGVAVFIDSNANGVADPGEPTTNSDASGRFAFGTLPAGKYDVRQVVPSGSYATGTGALFRLEVSGKEEKPPVATFTDAPLFTVTGTSFDDRNSNGQQDRGEDGIAGRLVFDDANGNGAADRGESRDLSDAKGQFSLDLLPGRHTIIESLPNGWLRTVPQGGVVEIAVDAERKVSPIFFGSTQTVSVSGFAFDDPNVNGLWEASESPVAGRTVYVDTNGNGAPDAGEPSAVSDANGQWSIAGLLPGNMVVRAVVPAPLAATTPAGAAYSLTLAGGDAGAGLDFGTRYAGASVVRRALFYNSSAYDGGSPAADARDDAAIATDKSALLPGASAAFANVSAYSRGINGIMLDVAGLPAGLAPTAADFVFRAGSTGGPSTWAPAPAPAQITLRRGAGAGGADRLTLTWPDGAIRNTWLQITVLPNGFTGLPAADVFYFGNLVGKTDVNPFATRVSALDLTAARSHLFTSRRAGIDNPYDFNRDGRVNPLDVLTVRQNLGRSLDPLVPPATRAAPLGIQSAWHGLDAEQ